MRTKTYIAFDGDADLMSYRTIQSWSADKNNPFTLNDAHDVNEARDNSLPESIINQLRERMEVSKNVLLLISSDTNKNRKGILQWEIGYALRNSLPIILVFIGYSSSTANTESLWKDKLFPKIPLTLRDTSLDKYCLISPFTRERVVSAIQLYSVNNLPSKGYSWHW